MDNYILSMDYKNKLAELFYFPKVFFLEDLNPHHNTKELAKLTGISRLTMQTVLKKKYHPYYINLVQALTPADFINRAQFHQWAL